VWTREWRARWPLVVKARSHVPHTCFFFWSGDEEVADEEGCVDAGDMGGDPEDVEESGRYWELVNCEW